MPPFDALKALRRAWLLVTATAMLEGCGTGVPPTLEPPQLVLERCATVSSTAPLEADLRAPLAGALRIDVGEHGVAVSVTATPDRGAPLELRSPVVRDAWHVLLLPVSEGEHLRLRIVSQDLAPAGGMACVRARLLRAHSPGARAGEAAARDLMAAERATAAGQWPAALEDYRRGARRLDAEGETLGAAQAWLAMAMIDSHQLDRGLDAIAVVSTARNALAAARLEPRAGPLLAQLLSIEAEALMDLPDLEANDLRVRKLLERARSMALPTTPEGAREAPRIDTLAGYWSFISHDWRVARTDFERAAEACVALVDPECAARAYQNLASLAEREQQPELADRDYRRALGALPAAGSPKLAADIDDNLSQLRGSLGLVSQAERLASEALRLHALAGDCEGGRRSLDGIGTLLAQVGDLDAARAYLHTALLECRPLLAEIAPGVPVDPRAAAQPEDECRLPGSAALDGETAAGVARAVFALTALDLASGDVSAARACTAAAAPLQALKGTGLRFAIAAAEADLTAGDAAAAYGGLESAANAARARDLPPGNRLRRAIDLDAAHALLDLGRPAEAWLRASRALRESAARSNPGELLESLRLAAMSVAQSGYPNPAISLLERGTEFAARVPVGSLDPEAAAAFVASQHALYSDLTELQSRGGLADRALLTAEAGRARAARAALARTQRNASGPGEADGSAALLALRSELAQRLDAVELAPVLSGSNAEAVSRALGEALATTSRPGPLEGDAEAGSADILRYAHQLAPGNVVVEYAAAGKELVAFVLQAGSLRQRRLGTRAEITASATRFVTLLQDPDTPASLLAASAARLAQLIWWPLGLQSADSITVVPEGAVSGVPLGALPWSAAERGVPVVARARIRLIPSLRYAWDRSATPRPRRASGYAGLGNPLFHVADWQRECSGAAGPIPAPPATSAWTERLAPLPGAAAELRSIGELAARFRPREPTHLLQGCAATRGALRELAVSPLRLLHLATHARIDAARPRLSALALTPQWEGTELRNTLGYADIVALHLAAHLVILGACDTLRGEVLAGEGVLGPAQAFLLGGADSVVGTLWSVDDRLTASFMQALYAHLFADRMSVGEALQRTQIDFMAVPGGASSHFWAAFALYGEADAAI